MLDADDVLQLPVTRLIGGREVKFKRFSMRDLVEWCAEEKAAEKRAVIQRHALNPKLDATIKNDELKRQDAKRITLGQLASYVDEPEGVEKVLRRSLKLSGEAKDDAAADALIGRIHWVYQQALAIQLLSPPPEPEPKTEAGQQQGPTEGAAGSSGSADTGPTSSANAA
jgi:hypothetical protein